MFCIVSSHLAAHQGAVHKRNQDYCSIKNRLRFAHHYGIEGEVELQTFWLSDRKSDSWSFACDQKSHNVLSQQMSTSNYMKNILIIEMCVKSYN